MIKETVLFQNREEAGQAIGKALAHYKGKDGIVFAIPRGGVEIGYYAACELQMPLDVVIPKKIGAPSNPEFALAAVMDEGTIFFNPSVPKHQLPQDYLSSEIKKKIMEIKTRMFLYRGNKEIPDVKNKFVFIMDDGVATGATLFAALNYFKKQSPAKIIAAVPVAPLDTLKKLQRAADEVVCVHSPSLFFSVGQFYADFHQVSDDEVLHYLHLHDETMRRRI